MPSVVQPAPPEILKLIRCGDQTCSSGICRCASALLACTGFCECYKLEDCQNRWTKVAAEQRNDDDEEEEDFVLKKT